MINNLIHYTFKNNLSVLAMEKEYEADKLETSSEKNVDLKTLFGYLVLSDKKENKKKDCNSWDVVSLPSTIKNNKEDPKSGEIEQLSVIANTSDHIKNWWDKPSGLLKGDKEDDKSREINSQEFERFLALSNSIFNKLEDWIKSGCDKEDVKSEKSDQSSSWDVASLPSTMKNNKEDVKSEKSDQSSSWDVVSLPSIMKSNKEDAKSEEINQLSVIATNSYYRTDTDTNYIEDITSKESDLDSYIINLPSLDSNRIGTIHSIINRIKILLEQEEINKNNYFQGQMEKYEQLNKISASVKKLAQQKDFITISEGLEHIDGYCQIYLSYLEIINNYTKQIIELFKYALIPKEVVPCFDNLYEKLQNDINQLEDINTIVKYLKKCIKDYKNKEFPKEQISIINEYLGILARLKRNFSRLNKETQKPAKTVECIVKFREEIKKKLSTNESDAANNLKTIHDRLKRAKQKGDKKRIETYTKDSKLSKEQLMKTSLTGRYSKFLESLHTSIMQVYSS